MRAEIPSEIHGFARAFPARAASRRCSPSKTPRNRKARFPHRHLPASRELALHNPWREERGHSRQPEPRRSHAPSRQSRGSDAVCRHMQLCHLLLRFGSPWLQSLVVGTVFKCASRRSTGRLGQVQGLSRSAFWLCRVLLIWCHIVMSRNAAAGACEMAQH